MTTRLKKIQFSSQKGSNDQLLYFTSPCFSDDHKQMVFIRDNEGSPNIYLKNIETSEEQPLTSNTEGCLKSYIYYDGHEIKGLSKASICFDPQKNVAYYIQNRNICCVDLKGNSRIIAKLPPNEVSAYTHVSHDGSRLCVPTTEGEAFDNILKNSGQFYFVDHKIKQNNLNSFLNVYDIDKGMLINREKVSNAWVTHVQFSPKNNNLILYNHEWASYNYGIRRMWLWDGIEHKMLRNEKDKRDRNDFICHEVWDRNGDFIIYHGRYINGACFLGRVDPDGSDICEIEFPHNYEREGHFVPGKEGLIITDGFYDRNILLRRGYYKIRSFFKLDNGPFCGRFITLLKVDWKKKTIKWIPLCKHGSNWFSQDNHPHPIFNQQCDKIYFNSNMNGSNSIYQINIEDILT